MVAVYVNLEVRSSAPTPLRRHAQFAVTTTLRGRCPSSPVLNKEYSGSCTLPFRWFGALWCASSPMVPEYIERPE